MRRNPKSQSRRESTGPRVRLGNFEPRSDGATAKPNQIENQKGPAMKVRRVLTIVAVALLLLLNASPASQAQSMQTESNEWQFVAPIFYYWVFQVDGDISAKGKTRDADLSIGGVLEDLDLNVQVYLEVDKGDWGAFVEPTFFNFSGESKQGGSKFKDSVDIALVDFAVQYRVWHTRDPKPMSIYAMAGVRYWNYDIQADGKGAAAPDANAHLDIIDPIIGARFRMDITEKLHLGTRFDVGGFGLTDKQSHFTWQTWVLLNYDVTKRFSVFGGYRALGLNYDENHGSQHKGVDVVFS